MIGPIERIESALLRANAKVGCGDGDFHCAINTALSEIPAIRQQARDIAELRAESAKLADDYLALQGSYAAVVAERDEARQLYALIADQRDAAEARLEDRYSQIDPSVR